LLKRSRRSSETSCARPSRRSSAGSSTSSSPSPERRLSGEDRDPYERRTVDEGLRICGETKPASAFDAAAINAGRAAAVATRATAVPAAPSRRRSRPNRANRQTIAHLEHVNEEV
jgi:hypothetical protein